MFIYFHKSLKVIKLHIVVKKCSFNGYNWATFHTNILPIGGLETFECLEKWEINTNKLHAIKPYIKGWEMHITAVVNIKSK